MIDTKIVFYNTVVIVQSAEAFGKIKTVNQKCFKHKGQAETYLYSHYTVFCDGKPNTSKEDFINLANGEDGFDLFTTLNGESWIVRFYIQEQDDFSLASDAFYEFDTVCRMEDVDMELEALGLEASEKEIREMAEEVNEYISDYDDFWREGIYEVIHRHYRNSGKV